MPEVANETRRAMTAISANPAGDVIYHGQLDGNGGRVILIEDAASRVIGTVPSIGSGPAGTARSLLADAIGPGALCQACGGHGRVAFDPYGMTAVPAPWDARCSPGDSATAGLEAITCRASGCDRGLCVPCEALQRAHAVTIGTEFRISRTAILDWLAGLDR
jgi:hypothetical protein